MRIGFLSHNDANLFRFRLALMKALVAQGHKVFAIAPREEKLDQFLFHGIIPVAWQVSRPSLNPFSALKSVYQLLVILNVIKLDLLHTFMAKPNILGNIAAKLARVPIVFNSITGLGSLYAENSLKIKILRWLLEKISRIVYRFSEMVVFQNEESLDYFVKRMIIPREKTKLIPGSGINIEYWKPEKSKKQGKTIILMASRLIKHKGIKEFVEAAQILSKKKDLNLEFWLVGAPDKGNPFVIYDRSLKENPALKYWGNLGDIKDLLEAADIFVYPSYYGEGVPRALLEACGMGKAIVTTNMPGCRMVVRDGVNGLLVPPRDSVALAQAIETLVLDTELRKVFGEASRKIAEDEFDEKFSIAEHFLIYQHFARAINS